MHIPALLDTIILVFQSRNGIFFLTILACVIAWYLVFKANPNGFFAYLDTRRRSRFERLEKYLSNSQLSDTDCVSAIREIYDAECFEQATGIYAEREKRAALISLRNRAASVASWRTIRKAKDYIDFDQSNCATIQNITIWHRFHYWMHMMIGWLVFSIGMFSILILSYLPGNRVLHTLTAIVTFFIFLGLALISFTQAQPYRCATLIKKALDADGNQGQPSAEMIDMPSDRPA